MDVHTPSQRSYNMSRIKGRDTKPEILVRSTLQKMGFRFRKNQKKLPGCPDIVMKKHNLIIFVHGCFWHSHNCKYGNVRVSSREEFWEKKRLDTKKRDKKYQISLIYEGWRVKILWECEIKNALRVDKVSDYLRGHLGLI